MIRKPVLIFSLVVLIIAGVLLLLTPNGEPQSGMSAENQIKLEQAKQQQKALIGGDFTLINQKGETVTNQSLMGEPRLVFFGFTHCPMICPTSLATMHETLTNLGEDAPQGIFISVDPERDTVERMQSYLTSFPTITGLTGEEAAIKQVKDAYKVYAQKMPMEGEDNGNYDMNHSGYIFLMDENGEYVKHFPHNVPVGVLESGIREAL